MKKKIVITLVVILSIAIACTIYFTKDTNNIPEENEVPSVTIPFVTEDIDFSLPDDSTLNTDNPPSKILYKFGDGSHTSLILEENDNTGENYKDNNNDLIFRYLYEGNTRHLAFVTNKKISRSLSYSNYIPSGKILKRDELQQISKQYLDKFIGENDYRIYRMDDEKIESGTTHFFAWTKYINDIPTWRQQVSIELTSDGNLISINNPDKKSKTEYLSKLDSMIDMSKSYISKDEAIGIAKIRIPNIKVESAELFFNVHYKLCWEIYYKAGYKDIIDINANTGEIIEYVIPTFPPVHT